MGGRIRQKQRKGRMLRERTRLPLMWTFFPRLKWRRFILTATDRTCSRPARGLRVNKSVRPGGCVRAYGSKLKVVYLMTNTCRPHLLYTTGFRTAASEEGEGGDGGARRGRTARDTDGTPAGPCELLRPESFTGGARESGGVAHSLGDLG